MFVFFFFSPSLGLSLLFNLSAFVFSLSPFCRFIYDKLYLRENCLHCQMSPTVVFFGWSNTSFLFADFSHFSFFPFRSFGKMLLWEGKIEWSRIGRTIQIHFYSNFRQSNLKSEKKKARKKGRELFVRKTFKVESKGNKRKFA